MARPLNSGLLVTDVELAEVVRRLDRNRVSVTRWAVAVEAGISDGGLRSRHKRRGLSWLEFLSKLRQEDRSADWLDAAEERLWAWLREKPDRSGEYEVRRAIGFIRTARMVAHAKRQETAA